MRRVSRKAINRFILAVIMALPVFAACVSDGTGPDGNALVKAKAGSTYIYDNTSYDDNGIGTTRTDTIKVVSTGNTVAGLADVLRLWTTMSRDTGFVRYDAKNDLVFINPLDTNRDGVKDDGFRIDTYPFASHGRMQVDLDTVIVNGSDYNINVDSIYYAGEETIALPAGTFTVSRVVVVGTFRSYTASGRLASYIREVETLYFAPKTGFLVRRTWEHEFLNTTSGALDRHRFVSEMNLKAYTL